MAQDLALVGPILLPAFAAILLLVVDLLPGGRDRTGAFLLAALGSLVSLLYTGFYLVDGRTGLAFAGTIDMDRTALWIALVVHFSSFLSILLSRSWLASRPSAADPEYHAFLLVSASGMVLLAAANDIVNVFLGLEILSVPLYLLAATQRREERSVEAGFKYLLLGAFASAFLLFGMALLFGSSGTTSLAAMADEMRRLGTSGGLAAVGAVLFLIGLLFKIGSAPFHMWTPDVYEGSPTPITAFMATATKAAAFGALLRAAPMLAEALTPELGARLISGVAVLSMIVGNLAALRQENLKRLLAYSSIAHAGYLLVGVAALIRSGGVLQDATSAVVYYLAAYSAMNLGAFAVAIVLDRGEGREGVTELEGLGRAKPALAAAMAVFALALGGIPPTAGFFGKLYVFRSAVEAGLVPLAVVAVLMSVVALFYYLRLLVLMYVSTGEGAAPRTDGIVAVTSLVTVALVLWLGVLPEWMVSLLQTPAVAG